MVWPMYLSLFGLLQDSENDSTMISNMKDLGREYMEKNKTDFAPKFHHKAMTFLNPTMKKLGIIKLSERKALHTDVENYLDTYYPDSTNVSTSEVSDLPMSVETTGTDFLDRFVSFDQTEDELESEIVRYIKHPIHSEVSMESWWTENGAKYPRLFKLFKKLSGIPATSASSERNFSVSGNIITDKRSLLLPKNVNNLIIVKSSL